MEKHIKEREQEGAEIDLYELAKKIWFHRRKMYISLGIAFIISIVLAFSIPKEYTVTVTLAPETTRRSSSNLASMAAMVGLGDLAAGTERDALNILLFPDILASNPFALELYNMPVQLLDTENKIPLNVCIENMRHPWWSSIIGFPGKLIGEFLSLFNNEEGNLIEKDTINPFQLTRQETKILSLIKKSMQANVDKTNGITTITVTMQDPIVAATVADSVVSKLQDYVTTYRTKKAAVDCAYWEKLYKDKQAEYYNAQQKYAVYLDENKSLFTQRSKIEGERLQNEMNLAYQVYNQTATQLQMAQGKLQEAKPVFAVVEPATVPLRPSAPRKMIIIVGCLFLAFIGTTGWILFGEDMWKEFRKGMKTKSITTD